MIPIQDLLNRIKWDKEFGKGFFLIGYYDRIEDRIITVPFTKIQFDPDDHFSFLLENELEETISIPYHRVRQVWKDGEIIWDRSKHETNETIKNA